jgi:hypothetical protein
MIYTCPDEPALGPTPGQSDDVFNTLLEIWGYIDIVIGIITSFTGKDPKPPVMIALRLAGPAVALVAFTYLYKLCIENTDGPKECVAGIVNSVNPNVLNDVTEVLFPFTQMHPSFDIVVKCNKWHLLETNAGYILSSAEGSEESSRGDPVMRAYVHSSRVCLTATGAFIGATVGGLAGAAAFGSIMAACPFVLPLCLLAAIFVGVFLALAGAFLGGHAMNTIAYRFVEPSTEVLADEELVGVGDYVTVEGKAISSGFDNGAIVFWFVDQVGIWGHEDRYTPPFSHELALERWPAVVPPEGHEWEHLEDSYCRRKDDEDEEQYWERLDDIHYLHPSDN